MTFLNFCKTLQFAAVAVALTFGASGTTAFADTITVSYLNPGVQSQTSVAGATYYVENFDGSFTGVTDFNGSGNTGTYTANTQGGFDNAPGGGYKIIPADVYGGAGGSGKYIVSLDFTPGAGIPTSYTLQLTNPVNYFGYWLSAQDPGDQLEIYRGNTLLYTFTPSIVNAALGNCPGGPYCGNPSMGGAVNISNYAFVQFYDAGHSFDKLVFTEKNTGNGYESDNHTIAELTSAPEGNMLPTPEPSGLVLLGTGVLGIAGSLRRRFKR